MKQDTDLLKLALSLDSDWDIVKAERVTRNDGPPVWELTLTRRRDGEAQSDGQGAENG